MRHGLLRRSGWRGGAVSGRARLSIAHLRWMTKLWTRRGEEQFGFLIMSGHPMHFGLRSPGGIDHRNVLGTELEEKKKEKHATWLQTKREYTQIVKMWTKSNQTKIGAQRNPKKIAEKHKKTLRKKLKKPQKGQAISLTHSEADRESKQPYRDAGVKQTSRTKCARVPQKFHCLCISLLFEVCWCRKKEAHNLDHYHSWPHCLRMKSMTS